MDLLLVGAIAVGIIVLIELVFFLALRFRARRQRAVVLQHPAAQKKRAA